MKTEERQAKDEEKGREKRARAHARAEDERAEDEHGGGKVKRETRRERRGGKG